MTLFDFIILAIFLISIVVGVIRGFIKEVLSIASWIVAGWLAYNYSVEAGEWLSQFISLGEGGLRTSVGFGALFVGTLFMFAIITYVLTKLLVRAPVKGVDRVLGLATGVVRAMAISAVLLVLLQAFEADDSPYWQDSKFIPHLLPTVGVVKNVFSKLWESDDPEEEIELKEELQNKLIEQGVEQLKNNAKT